jgi:hypothetical protein
VGDVKQPVTVVLEGDTDVPIARKILCASGLSAAKFIDCGGKDQLDSQLNGYNAAARFSPWLVMRDLDAAECAPTLVQELLPEPSEYMCLRIPVRSVEAWILADQEGIARFLRVSKGQVPARPEELPKPKRALVDLARKSRKPTVVADMVPKEGMSRTTGPNYAGRLIEFGTELWSVDRAIPRSASLSRAVNALRRLAERLELSSPT